MNLANFEEHIDNTILNRGHNYYLDKKVEDLNELSPGTWESFVDGTQDYYVSIDLEEAQIIDCTCECPYEYGPICKHIVATLYALVDELKISAKPSVKTTKKKRVKKKDEVAEIFSKVDKQELQQFIQKQFSTSRGMKGAFIAYFAEYLDEDINKKYQTIVKNIYKAAKGSYGFIDYRSTYKLERPLNDLINNAYELANRKKVTEALAISKSVIENIPKFIHYMDDSDGSAGGLFNAAFDLFIEIGQQAHPELKDELFKYCLKELPKEKYSDFCFDDDFLGVLPLLVTTKKQETQLLKILDKQIEKAKKKNSTYSLVRYIQEKISYFLNSNQQDKAQDLIIENKEHADIRKILVNQKIDAKDFEQAKELINEGILIAEKNGLPGNTNDWKIMLLNIAKSENNKKDIRAFSEWLFNNNYRDMDYYKVLRSTYNKEDWKTKCESILDEIKGKNQYGGLGVAEEIADIFIEEKYFDRLLKLLQLNPEHIQFIDNYSQLVLKDNPDHILELYVSGIKKFAEKTGRPIYNQVVKYIKKMNSIPKNEAYISELIDFFRSEYNNRPAMMEIIDKKFPNY